MTQTFAPAGRRGRPSNAELAARALNAEAPQAPATRAAETRARRRQRTSDGPDRHLKLGVAQEAKDPNYVYRWINDTVSGRIHAKTVSDDWDVVQERELGASYDAASDKSEGTPVKRIVGTQEGGQPLYAYLCRKPREFYEEDKQAEQEPITERESDLRRGAIADPAALSGPHSYVPGGKNTITTGRG